VSLSITRHAEATITATLARSGARWFAVYDGGAETWGKRFEHDWPRDSARFGNWKVLHDPPATAGDER
jgi:hypothetical protein